MSRRDRPDVVRLALGVTAGLACVGLGVVETWRTWLTGATAYWFVSLCVGGAMVVIGIVTAVRPSQEGLPTRRPWLFAVLVVGSLLATNATLWTVVVPVLLVTAVVLTVRGSEAGPPGHGHARVASTPMRSEDGQTG